jgi:hypothetical protein
VHRPVFSFLSLLSGFFFDPDSYVSRAILVRTIVAQVERKVSFVCSRILSFSLKLLLIITHLNYVMCRALLFGWTGEGHAPERG